MKETYFNVEAKVIPTSTFSVNNRTLKPNQPKGPSFTPYMFAICPTNGLEEFQAPKSTLPTRGPVTKSQEPEAKKDEERATKSLKGQSKKRKKFVTAKDKNPSQPLASTPVVAELHKEALQATSGQTCLGVTGHDASSTFIAKADLGNIDPKDSLPLKQVQERGAGSMDLESLKDDRPLQVSSDDETEV
nr:hypothetical protein [Tanacetum cinerariifolium]